MLQVGGSAFKRILFTGQVARVVARPCYGGLLRSRETWLFGGMAIEHVYIYICTPFGIMNINRIGETIRTFLARVRKFKIKITRSILGREKRR